MVLPRASARWAGRLSHQSFKTTRGTASRRSWQTAQRRGYAEAGGEGAHSTHKSSSELPWAVVSIAITIPASWYLIQPQLRRHVYKDGGDGHGGHHDENHGGEHAMGKEHKESEEGTSGEGKESEEEKGDNHGGDDEEKAEEGGSDEGSAEGGNGGLSGGKAPAGPSDHGSDKEGHGKPDGANVEGVQFKGATSGGTKEGEQGDTRKHIPDAKGGNKLRIESDYGTKLGEATESDQDADNEDMAAASKSTGTGGSNGSQSAKQEGLSNTDTKHSTDIRNDPGKSKKGDGTPETAKAKGTVDPSRKQV